MSKKNVFIFFAHYYFNVFHAELAFLFVIYPDLILEYCQIQCGECNNLNVLIATNNQLQNECQQS